MSINKLSTQSTHLWKHVGAFIIRVLLVMIVTVILGWLFSHPGDAKTALPTALNWALFSLLAAGACAAILKMLSEVILLSWVLSRAPLAGTVCGVMQGQGWIPAGLWGGVMIVAISVLISLALSLPRLVEWLTRRGTALSREFMIGEFQADVLSGSITGLFLVVGWVFISAPS